MRSITIKSIIILVICILFPSFLQAHLDTPAKILHEPDSLIPAKLIDPLTLDSLNKLSLRSTITPLKMLRSTDSHWYGNYLDFRKEDCDFEMTLKRRNDIISGHYSLRYGIGDVHGATEDDLGFISGTMVNDSINIILSSESHREVSMKLIGKSVEVFVPEFNSTNTVISGTIIEEDPILFSKGSFMLWKRY